MTYSEKLKDPRWQKKRLETFSRDRFACRTCGQIDKQLHAHHLYYVAGREPWEYPDGCIVTLCFECHKEHGETNKFAGWELLISQLNSAPLVRLPGSPSDIFRRLWSHMQQRKGEFGLTDAEIFLCVMNLFNTPSYFEPVAEELIKERRIQELMAEEEAKGEECPAAS
jgi:hypothetical protein